MKTTSTFARLFLLLHCYSAVHADTFGTGANVFEIEFVPIGNPSNVADTTGVPNPVGSVPYEYRIGKFEISEEMIDKANTETAGDSNPLSITHDGRGANRPATSVSWFEAAEFVNWLNISSAGTPAYRFDDDGNFLLWDPGDAGYNPNNLYRNSLATYFLPSVDEWYKAAYHDAAAGTAATYFDYPTASDTAPTPVASGMAAETAVYNQSFATGPADVTLAGGLSSYGTMGQGGNVFEWEETDFDLSNDSASSARGIRGGIWDDNAFGLSSSDRIRDNPTNRNGDVGFRVASIAIPESSTSTLVLIAALVVGLSRRRQ